MDNGNVRQQQDATAESRYTTIDFKENNNDNRSEAAESDVSKTPGSSRCSSIAWSELGRISKNQFIEDKFRGLKRRSSVENFGQFGFLLPALALVPLADGADALTQQFGDLQGEHRELKLAAAHIDDALTGRGCYGKARSFFKPRYAQRCFDILDNVWFKRLMIINVVVHSLLAFFEPPSVTVKGISPAVCVLDLLCILLYIFDIAITITFLTWPVFWSRKGEARAWNGVQFVFVSMFVLDYIVMLCSIATQENIPQIFRCLRLAIVLCKAKNIRHIFMVLITIGVKLSKVFSIIFVFVWVFSCTSLYVLMDIYNCQQSSTNSSAIVSVYMGKEIPCAVEDKEKVYIGTFNHIGLAMLRLFVLLSTENFPEVMLPAMRVQGLYFLFFAFYVFVGVFFLTAIVLAIVVDSYWEFSKKHVKKERARERAELAKAWNLLDPLGHGALSMYEDKFVELFRLLKPKNTDEENMMLIEMLDTNEDGDIDSFEWTTMLSQVLGYEFEDSSDILVIDETPPAFRWVFKLREGAAYITETIIFSRFILVLIIIHCIFFAFKWKGQTDAKELILQVLKSIIVTIFLLESLMRVLVLGKKIFVLLELMDAALVVLAFITNFVWYAPESPSLPQLRTYTTVVSCIAVFFRLPFNNSHLKQAMEVFIRVAPVMVDLMCILFIIFYLFAAVGMELFNNAPPSSNGHIYLQSCGLGFETFWCACLILFQMVTTSNWHEIMNSVIESTKTHWSSLYFVLAYIIVNMVVMNLFVAIAIEAFNKLATLQEEQQPPLGRQASDQRPVTTKMFVKTQAVKMLNTFASSIFGSTRAEQVVGRRQSLAATNVRRPSTFKRGSIAVAKSNGTLKEEDEKQQDDDENFKGDKREYKLKKRMKAKKKTKRNISSAERRARVVTAFKGGHDIDLDLTVGDEVTIIQKTDNWWQGHCKNKVGWFPASHVVMGTIKAVPEYRRRRKQSNRAETGDGDALANDASPNEDRVFDFRKERTQGSSYGTENSFYRERSSTFGNQPPGTPPAGVRGRIKMKKTGDWRRNILGEMTVMNAEEMRELNSIMRAELRTPVGRPRSRSKKLSGLSRDGDSLREAFPEDAEYCEIGQGSSRPASARSIDTRPYSGRYHVPGSPRLNAVEPYGGRPRHLPQIKPGVPVVEFIAPGSPTPPTVTMVIQNETLHGKRLKVDKPSPPKPKAKTKKNPEKPKKGEMPDWAMKFVTDKQLTVGDDVKLDEVKNSKGYSKSGSRAGTGTGTGTGTSTGTRTGTGTGTGTGARTGTRTLKSGTKNVKSRSTGSIPGEVDAFGRKGSSPDTRKKSLASSSVPGKGTVHRPTTPRVGQAFDKPVF